MGDASRQAACDHVYRKYPLLAGVRPAVQSAGPNRVYTFAKDVPTSPGGPSLRQIVRVTVDAAGKIVKVVASR
jgi:hypothetical protein